MLDDTAFNGYNSIKIKVIFSPSLTGITFMQTLALDVECLADKFLCIGVSDATSITFILRQTPLTISLI